MLKYRDSTINTPIIILINYRFFLLFISLLHTYIYDILTYSYIKRYALYHDIRFHLLTIIFLETVALSIVKRTK